MPDTNQTETKEPVPTATATAVPHDKDAKAHAKDADKHAKDADKHAKDAEKHEKEAAKHEKDGKHVKEAKHEAQAEAHKEAKAHHEKEAVKHDKDAAKHEKEAAHHDKHHHGKDGAHAHGADPSDKEFWLQRWKEDEPGWKVGERAGAPIFRHNLREMVAKQPLGTEAMPVRGARVFVPLCGDSHIMSFLANNGAHVVGVDFNADALRNFLEFLGHQYVKSAHKHITIYTATNIGIGGSLELIGAELFSAIDEYITPDLQRKPETAFDMIYDRGAFVAMPPERRREYLDAILRLLRPAGAPGLGRSKPGSQAIDDICLPAVPCVYFETVVRRADGKAGGTSAGPPYHVEVAEVSSQFFPTSNGYVVVPLTRMPPEQASAPPPELDHQPLMNAPPGELTAAEEARLAEEKKLGHEHGAAKHHGDKAEADKGHADEEKKKAEPEKHADEKKKAEADKKHADEEKKKAEADKKHADDKSKKPAPVEDKKHADEKRAAEQEKTLADERKKAEDKRHADEKKALDTEKKEADRAKDAEEKRRVDDKKKAEDTKHETEKKAFDADKKHAEDRKDSEDKRHSEAKQSSSHTETRHFEERRTTQEETRTSSEATRFEEKRFEEKRFEEHRYESTSGTASKPLAPPPRDNAAEEGALVPAEKNAVVPAAPRPPAPAAAAPAQPVPTQRAPATSQAPFEFVSYGVYRLRS